MLGEGVLAPLLDFFRNRLTRPTVTRRRRPHRDRFGAGGGGPRRGRCLRQFGLTTGRASGTWASRAGSRIQGGSTRGLVTVPGLV